MRRSLRLLAPALVVLLAAGCRPQPPADTSTRRAMAGEPIHEKAAEYLALLHAGYEQRDYRAALVLADSAARSEPTLADIPYYRGLVYSQLSDLEAAEENLRRAVALDPEYRGAWFHLGHNRFQKGHYREAIRYYREEERTIRRSPRDVRDFYAETDRAALPTVYLQIGRSYEKLGVPDSARLGYELALREDSTSAQAHAWLAELYQTQGDLDRAVSSARNAVRHDPENLEFRYLHASLLLRAGQAQEALAGLEEVVRRRPAHRGANYNAAQALLRLGRPDEAKPFLDRADTLEQLESDIAQAQAAAYLQPETASRWVQLAGLLLQAGRGGEARHAFGVAAFLQPRNFALQNDIANLDLAMGDTTGAVYRYESILRQDSTQSDVWLNLGVVYAMAGHRSAARQAWLKALQFQPNHPEAKAYLARLSSTP